MRDWLIHICILPPCACSGLSAAAAVQPPTWLCHLDPHPRPSHPRRRHLLSTHSHRCIQRQISFSSPCPSQPQPCIISHPHRHREVSCHRRGGAQRQAANDSGSEHRQPEATLIVGSAYSSSSSTVVCLSAIVLSRVPQVKWPSVRGWPLVPAP